MDGEDRDNRIRDFVEDVNSKREKEELEEKKNLKVEPAPVPLPKPQAVMREYKQVRAPSESLPESRGTGRVNESFSESKRNMTTPVTAVKFNSPEAKELSEDVKKTVKEKIIPSLKRKDRKKG